MPKQSKKIEDFSGGLNTYADPQNIGDNELAQCSGFKPDKGAITVLGDMRALYTLGTGDDEAGENINLEPGYGLFTFSHDYDKDGDLAATNYFVIQNGRQLNIYDDVDHTWIDNLVDMGTGSSDNALASFKPCFFFVDGALRVSPGNFDVVNTGSATVAAESAGGPDDDIGSFSLIQWTTSGGDPDAAAGDIIVINRGEYIVQGHYVDSSDEYLIVTRNVTGLFISEAPTTTTIYSMPDTRWRGIVQRRCFSELTTLGMFSEWYTSPMHPHPPANIYAGLDAENRIYTPFSVNIETGDMPTADHANTYSGDIIIGTRSNIANTDATWDTTIRLYMTALYDDVGQESQPKKVAASTTDALVPGIEFAVTVLVQYSDDGSNYRINKRVTGGRLYYEDTVDGLGILYQLLDIDFEKGCKKVESEAYTPWVERSANKEAMCPTTTGATGTSRTGANAFVWTFAPKTFTYEINTGYPMKTTTHARFKTAVVANRRLYVGNVYQNGKSHGDRIIYSPVNKFDILPDTNALPLAIGDGDEIVKLASFADRLLSFKKRTLYIINIGGGAISAFIESQHSNKGVENPSQVCDTEYGTAWVNKFGVFLYDGQKINELTKGRLQLSSSTRGLGLNVTESDIPLIGYDPLNKWLVIDPQSAINDAYDVEGWIFDFKNGSWTWTQTLTATDNYKTNMINTHDNKLVVASGTNSSYTPDFFTLQSVANSYDLAATKLFLLTKDFTLDSPGARKNLYGVIFTYELNSASGGSSIEADIIYKHSTGETTVAMIEAASGTTYYTEALGFKNTSGKRVTVKLVPQTAITNANSFQLKLSNADASHDMSDIFVLYNITFSFRVKGAR